MRNLTCRVCGEFAKDMKEYEIMACDCDMSVDDYVKTYEGTYLSEDGKFTCTDCYIKQGQPSIGEILEDVLFQSV